MGVVGEHLSSLLERQIRDHGLVVWFDPEGHYEDFVKTFSIPDAAVEICGESVFEFRRRTEPHLSAMEKDTPPKLLAYVPRERRETRNALVELTAPGVVVEPGGNSINRNTRLLVVARSALKNRLGGAWDADLEKRIEAGRMTLADLERLGEKRSSILSLVFDTAHPPEVALKFLADPSLDGEISDRDAAPDLASLLESEFTLPEDDDTADPDALRERFARHLLITDFIGSMPSPTPPRFASVEVAAGDDEARACASLVHAWRNRGDLRKSYADHADRVETGMSLSTLTNELDDDLVGTLSRLHTFAGAEAAFQSAVEARLLETPGSADEKLRGIVKGRLEGFWARWPERYPDILPRWLLIEAAMELLAGASEVEAGIESVSGGAGEILERYAEGSPAETPWCDLDTRHRNLERRNLDYFRPVHENRGALESLVARARRRYREAGEALSERFLDSLKDAGFDLSGVSRQSGIYAGKVAPALKSGAKVAYLLVDSLRYEMARELAGQMEKDYEVELSAALATAPTITEVGMAALMPGAESGLSVKRVGKGKIGLEVAGSLLTTRKSRVDHMKKHAAATASVADMKLEDLLRPSRGVRQKIKDADLVFVTSQEIDEQGEIGGAAARRFMDEVLRWLPRAIRTLADLGCEEVIVAADHGYLFADELGSDTVIEAPGGDTADLHRRAWVGVGGMDEPSFFRFPLSRLGYGGGLDIAVPRGFGAFKSPGGAAAYFHGGMSLQEMAVPALRVKSGVGSDAVHTADVDWELRMNAKGISTRFATVLVGGVPRGILETHLPRVRVEARVDGSIVSETVSATYDFSDSTLDVGLRMAEGRVEENTVTIMVDPDEHPEAAKGVASIHLLDSTTGIELARVEGVETDISV